MRERKRVFKWWWGWNVERLERWLEERESGGWHLASINGSGLVFTFERGEPRRIAYRIDYQTQPGEDYRLLFEDAGWALAGSGAGWYYWRMPHTGTRPEIFTDVESLIGRNRRQMRLLAVLLAVQIPTAVVLAGRDATPFVSAVAFIQLALVVVMGLALLRFLIANRALRSRL